MSKFNNKEKAILKSAAKAVASYVIISVAIHVACNAIVKK